MVKERSKVLMCGGSRLSIQIFLLWIPFVDFLTGAVESKKKLCFHFDQIEVRGAVTVFVEPGKRNRQVEYFADSSIIDTVTTEVRDRTLYIDANNSYSLTRIIPLLRLSAQRVFPIEVIVSIESLKEIRLLEKSNLNIKQVSGKEIKLYSNSTGFLHCSGLRHEKISVRHDGSGEIALKGREIIHLDAQVYGSGSLKCEELFLEKATIQHHGTGQVMIAPNNWLDARINNSGNLYLLEKPEGRVVKNQGNGGRIIEQY